MTLITELVYLILQKLFTAISMHAVAIHTLFSWPKRKKIIGSSFFLDPTGANALLTQMEEG